MYNRQLAFYVSKAGCERTSGRGDLLGALAVLGHEEAYHAGIELAPRKSLQLRDGFRGRALGAVRRVPGHGVEDLGYGHDARPERDVLARQPRRVTLAIPS